MTPSDTILLCELGFNNEEINAIEKLAKEDECNIKTFVKRSLICYENWLHRNIKKPELRPPAEITMEELKLPWACCAGKIPHGESCPVCGDKE